MSEFEPREGCSACDYVRHHPGVHLPSFDVHGQAERYLTGKVSMGVIAEEEGLTRAAVSASFIRHVGPGVGRLAAQARHDGRTEERRRSKLARRDEAPSYGQEPKYGLDEFVAALKEVYASLDLDGPMSHEVYDVNRDRARHPAASGMMLNRHGGARWNELCEAAGLPVNEPVRQDYTRQSDDKLLADLARWIIEYRAKHGRWARLSAEKYGDWARAHRYSPEPPASRALVVKRIGWSTALDQALDMVYGDKRGVVE